MANWNQSQKHNLAKFLYDVAKSIFGAVVVVGGLKGGITSTLSVLLITAVIILTALCLEKEDAGKAGKD